MQWRYRIYAYGLTVGIPVIYAYGLTVGIDGTRGVMPTAAVRAVCLALTGQPPVRSQISMTTACYMPTGTVGVVASFADGVLLPTGPVGAVVLFADGGHMPTGTVGIDRVLPTA